MKMETKKDDIQSFEGVRFLIPAEILPQSVELFGAGKFVSINAAGRLVEVEGLKFLEVDTWRLE